MFCFIFEGKENLQNKTVASFNTFQRVGRSNKPNSEEFGHMNHRNEKKNYVINEIRIY